MNRRLPPLSVVHGMFFNFHFSIVNFQTMINSQLPIFYFALFENLIIENCLETEN